MKILIICLFSCLFYSCDNQEKAADDYVLVEFASKLEEDFDKLKNSEKEN